MVATLSSTALTLADWASRSEDNVQQSAIVELLSQDNEMITDMLVLPSNSATGHKTTVRVGLPTPTWRLLNYGALDGKSVTAPVVDTWGNLEIFGQVDKDIADLNGNTAEFRMSEAIPFFQSMSQEMARTMIYGNLAVNPERFHGFAPRYNTVNIATAQTAANVIDMQGTASTNTSIWIVCWGSNTCHALSPKGKPTGLMHEDRGTERIFPSTGGSYIAYVDHYKWELGLTLRDWRYVVRLCNIDVALLNGVNAANLITGLIRGLRRLPTGATRYNPVTSSDATTISGTMGRVAIYCNRVVSTYLHLQALNKSNAALQLSQFAGETVLTFLGVPIRTVDAILNTEARVV